MVWVFRINLRKRDKWAAVHRPALDLRQLIDRDASREDRPRAHPSREQSRERERNAAILPGVSGEGTGIDLELDQSAHGFECVAK